MSADSAQQAAAAMDCYGHLLRMMAPRAAAICIYDAAGNVLWSSRAHADAPDLHGAVLQRVGPDGADRLAEGGLQRLDSGDAAYLAPLRDADGTALLGAVGVLLSTDAEQSQPYSMFRGLVTPVLQALERQLQMQRRLAAAEAAPSAPTQAGAAVSRRSRAGDGDLELLATLTDDQTLQADSGGMLGGLVARCLAHFNVAMCALVVPGKGIEVCRRRGEAADAISEGLLSGTQRNLLAMAQLNGKPFVANRLPKARDGSTSTRNTLPFKVLSCPVHDRRNAVQGILALFQLPDGPDFNERDTRLVALVARRAANLLQSQHDEATGCLTRAAFDRVVSRAVARSRGTATHAMLYLDVDKMHVINDRFGHEAGDEVIARVADLARTGLAAGDELARLPGDRFAVFLRERDIDGARDYAVALLASVNQLSFVRHDHTVQISVSVGIALVPASQQPVADALAAAEVASKAAKDRGRNRAETYQEEDQSIIRRHRDIVVLGQLNQALTQSEFRLYAQPVFSLRDGRPYGFEVLLRMVDGDGGTLAPDKFLSSAERYQLMPAIDRWVVDRVLAELSPVAGALEAHGLHVFVNLSGQSLGDDGFLQYLQQRLRGDDRPTRQLVFEVTESAAISRLSVARELIGRVTALGARFALDDFGTGLSSFAYLNSLPVQMVKIDGGFVRELNESRVSTSMVTAIVQVARVMNLQTVAECVESAAVSERVRALGVDFVQGYHSGEPEPLAEVLVRLLGKETFAEESRVPEQSAADTRPDA